MTPKLVALTAAATLTLALAGCQSGNGDVDSTSDNMPTAMDDGTAASMTDMKPYPGYKTFFKDGKSFIAAESDNLEPIRNGQMPPANKTITMVDSRGNEYVFIDTGAVTAADLIAGFRARNTNVTLTQQ